MQRISNLPIQSQLKAIDVSNKFGLTDLTKQIIGLINDQINCKSCIPIFVYAFNTNNDQLQQIVEPFILSNLQQLTLNEQQLVVELNQKFGLLKRLAAYLNKCFRMIYENPQTLQTFSVQKF